MLSLLSSKGERGWGRIDIPIWGEQIGDVLDGDGCDVDGRRQLHHNHTMTTTKRPALPRRGPWLKDGPENRQKCLE